MPSDDRLISRRDLLTAMAGLAGTALLGRLAWADPVRAATAWPSLATLGGAETPRNMPAPAGSPIGLGASIHEATLHGHESLVLPGVDSWRDLTGFFPAILPLWSPFDIDLPAPRGGQFPATWLLDGLWARGIQPAVYARSAGEGRWATHGYEAILRGERDEAIERWGLAAAADGRRLILRWDQEMNGTFPWSLREPAEYVRVFRRVSDRIRRVAGATNVELHFCPALRRRAGGLDEVQSYFPGDDWCQLVGFDAYSRTAEWEPIAEQWGPMLQRLRRMSDRPVLVGEFGRRVDLPARPAWLATLADVRGVGGAVYFDMDLTQHAWPEHRWLMSRPMRAVYAGLQGSRLLGGAQRQE